jgi:hypothetical protein
VDHRRREHERKNDCRDASSHLVPSCGTRARICPAADDFAEPEIGNAPEIGAGCEWQEMGART